MNIRLKVGLVLILLAGALLWHGWYSTAQGDPLSDLPTATAEQAPEGAETPEAAPAETAPEEPEMEAEEAEEEEPAASEDAEDESEEAVAEYIEDISECLDCHDVAGPSFLRTIHAKATDPIRGTPMDCQSCHGPGSLHVEEGGDAELIINPGRLEPAAATQICLKCHEAMHAQADWRFSEHAAANVACIECHKVHPEEKKKVFPKMLKENQPELCYNCHQEQKAQVNWPSHHPIREGRILCTDCHNPHGGGLSAFRGAPDDRELCLRCHARYRGPFALEHAPVTDSCLICHRPHGAVENNLLVTSETHLCLRCHVTAHNPHRVARLLPADELQYRVLYFSRCSNCHQEVHGTDVGPSFTR